MYIHIFVLLRNVFYTSFYTVKLRIVNTVGDGIYIYIRIVYKNPGIPFTRFTGLWWWRCFWLSLTLTFLLARLSKLRNSNLCYVHIAVKCLWRKDPQRQKSVRRESLLPRLYISIRNVQHYRPLYKPIRVDIAFSQRHRKVVFFFLFSKVVRIHLESEIIF